VKFGSSFSAVIDDLTSSIIVDSFTRHAPALLRRWRYR
jgi:hypothetical protein